MAAELELVFDQLAPENCHVNLSSLNPMYPIRAVSRTTQLVLALRTIYQNMQNLDDNFNVDIDDN